MDRARERARSVSTVRRCDCRHIGGTGDAASDKWPIQHAAAPAYYKGIVQERRQSSIGAPGKLTSPVASASTSAGLVSGAQHGDVEVPVDDNAVHARFRDTRPAE
jgi:hypothetical protein